MKERKLSISGGPGTYQVRLDGLDVAKGIRNLTLQMGVDHDIPVATLDLVVWSIEDAELAAIPRIPDATRELLVGLGWAPPAQEEQPGAGFGLYVPIPIEHHPYDPECCPTRDEPGCSPRTETTSKQATAKVVGEPRLFAEEIYGVIRDLDLAHTVANIDASARPEPDSHAAMVFLTSHATEDTANQLAEAFAARGWRASVALGNTKIHVYIPTPDKRSAPSGETP